MKIIYAIFYIPSTAMVTIFILLKAALIKPKNEVEFSLACQKNITNWKMFKDSNIIESSFSFIFWLWIIL